MYSNKNNQPQSIDCQLVILNYCTREQDNPDSAEAPKILGNDGAGDYKAAKAQSPCTPDTALTLIDPAIANYRSDHITVSMAIGFNHEEFMHKLSDTIAVEKLKLAKGLPLLSEIKLDPKSAYNKLNMNISSAFWP
ncbi:hypothetical protein [Pedobacter sp. L105]|uniref:hypothetical protein n=1 Tax=Pedobacter sp. L105 TaxID=1641871 RepID=UPI00131C22FC|nr:hypothetical protein [Pedobacter sp. L105]